MKTSPELRYFRRHFTSSTLTLSCIRKEEREGGREGGREGEREVEGIEEKCNSSQADHHRHAPSFP